MHDAGDRHAVFELFVDNAVAANHDRPGGRNSFGTAFENRAKDVELQCPLRESHDVERGLRIGPHRVDVAQGVCRRDLAEYVRVVDDGRKEINRVYNRQVRTKAEYSCIVGRLGPDDHVSVIELWKVVQHVHQVGWAELRRSTGRRHPLR